MYIDAYKCYLQLTLKVAANYDETRYVNEYIIFVCLGKTLFDVFILRNFIIVNRTIRKLRICYNFSSY